MNCRCLSVALAVALLALPALADTLVLTNGRDINCEIRKETYSEIEYRRAGVSSTQSVDTSEVASVTYGRTSPEFNEALKLEAAGRMGEAAGFFFTAANDSDLPKHVRATALFRCAEDLLIDSDFANAAKYFDQLLETYKDTRHRASALLGLGTAQLNTRQFGAAAQTFQQLKGESDTHGYGERWGLDANFYLLLSAEAQGKDGVVEGYRELRAMAKADYPDIANKCSLRLGRVALTRGEGKDAEAMFDEILESRTETRDEVVAGAYNGLGALNFGRARHLLNADASSDTQRKAAEERALEYFHDALMAHLRVVVNYPGIRAEQPEALYTAGQCFLNISAMDAEKSDWRMRGLQLLKRCTDNYAGTTWADKAAAEF